MKTAEEETNSSVLFCEEIYVLSQNDQLLIIHSSQTASYHNSNFVDNKTKRRLYWQYIAMHPAHAERSMAKWLPEAQRLALVFLKWCSFGELAVEIRFSS